MSCDWVKASITLYLYQELDEGEQNRLEEHTETCENCALALQQEQRFLQTLNERPVAEVSHTLLAECRHDLMRSVYREERAPSREGLMSWWPGVERVLASLWRPAWQPAVVTALLAVRAQEAKARQVKYLTVDASPMSRPILEKFGFGLMAYSYPCKWKQKS